MTSLSSRLTKRVVDAAQPAAKDYVLWDNELPGFGLPGFGLRVYSLSRATR